MVAQAEAALSGGRSERANTSSKETRQVDAAGQAILSLLHKASSIAEVNNQRAAEIAEKAMQQLRAAEDRITLLQSEAQFYRERSEQAEKWLARIYEEIERSLFGHLNRSEWACS